MEISIKADPASTSGQLLYAARHLFNSVGYWNTDTNKIAREAGFAPATFYKHFEDKRDIFLAVYREWVLAEWDDIEGAYAGGGDRQVSAREAIRRILEHHRRWAGFRRSLRALSLTDPVVWQARLEQRRSQMAFLEGLLERQGATGIPKSELLICLFTIERMCDAIADGESQALGVDDEKLLDELDALLQSLAMNG